MNPYLDAPPAATRAEPPLGAAPPALVALAVAVGVGVLLVALGVAPGAALGLAAIGGSVTGLVATARRIAHDWARGPGD